MISADSLVLSEKYRPKKIDELILPEQTKKQLKDAISNSSIPNFLMYGSAGTGKTSACKAIANELGADLMYINASLERSIDIIRNQVISFSSAVSFGGGVKIVLLDEFDGMLPLQQNALKGVIEEFPNARFFFTSNHVNKVIEPIRSRCVNIDFKIDNKQKADIAAKFFKRTSQILTAEGIEFDKAALAALVKKFFPDFRRTLNEIQRHSLGGKIDASALVDDKTESLSVLYESIKRKDFISCRTWIAQNSDLDTHVIFRDIYDTALDKITNESVPDLVLLISKYQYQATHSVDQEILLAAFIVEFMINIQWK
jgi:DNA polymerase III delta prime subunit